MFEYSWFYSWMVCDGKRVKAIENGVTTLFIGSGYEITNPGTGQTVTKYYFAGTTRIAVRKSVVPQSSTLTYLLGDHLGSTSLVTSDTGSLLVETRYKPWGEVRYTTPNKSLPTRFTFTGQYSYVNDDATDLGNVGFGLMYYNARWMDPQLGRFAQADTIVPGGVQGYDRYAYVNNNPVNFNDPTGHCPEEDKVCRDRLYATLPTSSGGGGSSGGNDDGNTPVDPGIVNSGHHNVCSDPCHYGPSESISSPGSSASSQPPPSLTSQDSTSSDVNDPIDAGLSGCASDFSCLYQIMKVVAKVIMSSLKKTPDVSKSGGIGDLITPDMQGEGANVYMHGYGGTKVR